MSIAPRQLAFVIDLNKCMGCQTCVVACKILWSNDKGMDHQWWAKVNTMPGRGYPKNWEQMGGGCDGDGNVVMGKKPTTEDYGAVMEFNYEEVFRENEVQGTRLAPKVPPTWGPNWDEDIGAGEWPNAYFFYLPRFCNQCTQASCLAACPHEAITKRPHDGVVEIVNPRACESCSDTPCMAACPYKEIFHNPVTLHAQKCHGCAPRIAEGVAPACVRMCPGRCVWVDFLDNKEGSVYKLVEEWKVALPLHPEFGTQPNVYYIPPLSLPRLASDGTPDHNRPRIPAEYLRSLFGPQVDRALETLKNEMGRRRKEPKERSELMDLLIVKRWHELLGPFGADPAEVEVQR